MYQEKLLTIMNRLRTIVKDCTNAEDAMAQFAPLQEEALSLLPAEDPQRYDVEATFLEAAGDAWFKFKDIANAEINYKKMVHTAVEAYKKDPQKYDFRLGFSYYKLAAFYRALLGFNQLLPSPKTLSEKEQTVYQATEKFYQNAIGCTMENAKKGMVKILEFHALCLSELLVFYAAVGNYDRAVSCGKDSVKLEKSLYEKYDDAAHSYRLAGRMNNLATLYMFQKEPQLAAETLEDAIFALEEHQKEDPAAFGLVLAKSYISLASCYHQCPEEKNLTDDTYEKGLSCMLAANNASAGRFTNDVLTSYIVIGDHYKKTNRLDLARQRYGLALKLATILHAQTKNPAYQTTIEHLKNAL